MILFAFEFDAVEEADDVIIAVILQFMIRSIGYKTLFGVVVKSQLFVPFFIGHVRDVDQHVDNLPPWFDRASPLIEVEYIPFRWMLLIFNLNQEDPHLSNLKVHNEDDKMECTSSNCAELV